MKAEIQKKFFCSIFFVGKHLHTKFRKISSNGLSLQIFFIFGQFLRVFWRKKGQNQKIVFLLNFLFLGSIYLPNFRKCYQTVWILPISSFLVTSGFLLAKKAPKMPKSKNSLFVAFSFVGRHLLTKFQKISLIDLNFANFLHLWSIFAVFWLFFGCFFGQKGQNRKLVFL